MTTEQRLERLERENRWIKRIGMMAAAVAAAVFLIGQGKAKELPDLVVRSLTMKDGDGKVRAALRMKDNKMPNLVLFDRQGQRRAGLGVSPGGPALAFFDSHGDQPTALLMGRNGSPGLTLRDGDGNIRAALFTTSEGSILSFRDKAGKERAYLFARTDGSPGLKLLDAQGKAIWKAPKD